MKNKTIVFYGRTQSGQIALSHLVALGHTVKVKPEDKLVSDLCETYGLEIVTLDTMGEFDLFISCHGAKIIPKKYLEDGKFINIHSCLWKYKGHDPIGRYIKNKDTRASVESHFMVEKVDAGEVITRVLFKTPIITTRQQYFDIEIPYLYKCIDETLRKVTMRTIAITRIKDMDIMLRLWLFYYSKYFDDLIVVGCQAGEGITDELAKEYKFTYIPSDTVVDSLGALSFMSEKQVELLKEYDWVMHTDLDEFVIADPKKYKDLIDFMLKSKEKQTFCEGYEIYKLQGQPPLDYSKPILEQRKYWWREWSGSYNKPCLSRIETKWVHGFHQIDGMPADEVKAIKDTGLYLIHLKHANDDELQNVENQKEELIPANIRKML